MLPGNLQVVGRPVEDTQVQGKVDHMQADHRQVALHKQVHIQLLEALFGLGETFVVPQELAWAQIVHLAYPVPLYVVSACMRRQCNIQHLIDS